MRLTFGQFTQVSDSGLHGPLVLLGLSWKMSLCYDVTSCAKLKYIVSFLNFGFDDNLMGSECLMIDMKHAVNTVEFAMFFR